MAEEVSYAEEQRRREVVTELEEIGDTLKILDLADWPEIDEKIVSAVARLEDLRPPGYLLEEARSGTGGVRSEEEWRVKIVNVYGDLAVGDRVRVKFPAGDRPLNGRLVFAGGSGPIEEIQVSGKAEYFVRIGGDLVPFYRDELARQE